MSVIDADARDGLSTHLDLPLAGTQLPCDYGPATRHAKRLLSDLGTTRMPAATEAALRVKPVPEDDSLADWARSGAMSLSGDPQGSPSGDGATLASAFRGALMAFNSLAPAAGLQTLRLGTELLGERAALAGLRRGGSRSPGGATRLLPAQDHWCAFSLARPDDEVLISALVSAEGSGDPWNRLADWLTTQPAEAAVTRAQLLGLPAAVVPEDDCEADEQLQARGHADRPTPFLVNRLDDAPRSTRKQPLVVDLSALWAGPLCSSLLALAGARVVKVESLQRPDGTRRGTRSFFDLLNGRKESVALDLRSGRSREALRKLLLRADVVIEGSRPRALIQLGIAADEILAAPGGRVWISLTGYGRTGPWRNRVGFGDDIAAAAGAVTLDASLPFFWGDAIADPLGGAHAAVAAIACLGCSGSFMVDVAMREVVRTALKLDRKPDCTPFKDGGTWWVETNLGRTAVREPTARTPPRGVDAFGASTTRLLRELGLVAR
jgi:hypothetical protein